MIPVLPLLDADPLGVGGLLPLVLVLAAAFLAGGVDAISGGGGLIQLPALMLLPGLGTVSALATNKFGSVIGTTASALTYHRRIGTAPRTTLPVAGVALAASMLGAHVATLLPTGVFTPAIIVALLLVLAVVMLRPGLTPTNASGTQEAALAHVLARALPASALIGFYDGMIGPGTGTFLIMALCLLTHVDFLHASASAKVINLATNLGALITFIPGGHVHWVLGAAVAAANMTGAHLGARMAIRFGAGFVRGVLCVVTLALVVRLALQEVGA